MELSQSLRLKQSQKLVMTPQLQQVIKLLQLPTMELVTLVRQELEANPVLEETVEQTPPEERKREEEQAAAAEENMDAWLQHAAEEGPRETRDRDQEEERESAREGRMVAVQTLEDFLLGQLAELEVDAESHRLARFLVGNLDDNGYLSAPLAELTGPAGATVEALEAALGLVHTLDPAGVGARDLKECLLLQLPESGGAASLARRVVGEHLGELESYSMNGCPALAKSLDVTESELAEAVKLIRMCDPKPGRPFADVAPAVFPDGRVEKVGEDYVVVVNDNGVPPLRLSQSYREMLANRAKLGEEERRYLQERFRSALMLMRGIEQRRVTLYRTLDHIVKHQREFLERGARGLRPLTLREVADAIGVHESTVSRVVANKHVSTPRGIFALRDFFSNRLPSHAANGTSSAQVRERIKDMIETETAGSPLSDEALAEKLRQEGIAIARRTITKYREAMKVPAAWLRKHGNGGSAGIMPR